MSQEEDTPMETNEAESSDSSSDDEQENADIERAEALEREIDANKYSYDCHVELVGLYRKLGDLNSMRAAYQRFHECFPLTPKLWLAWIKDEISLATTPAQQKRVLELFDKAVEDYLSVELWIEYAQYSIGATDLATTRQILERGLQAAGLHCSEGSLLWDTLRELENAHVSLHEQGTDAWREQVNRVAEVFKRQLSVPLIGMENTYKEWEDWTGSLPEGALGVDKETVEWGYNKALQLLDTYKPFEERLLTADTNDEIYDIYKSYIKSVSDPMTTVCLYERAVLPLCLVPALWLDYCQFVFKLGDLADKVSSRALRNCPWSEELWVQRLRILEHLKKGDEEVMRSFEQGISSINTSGVELWLSYIEYVHRNLNSPEKLDKLFDQAFNQLGYEGDPTCKVMRWHARLLARRGDMPAARKLWKTILQRNKGSASLWIEYANLERQYGETAQVQNIFKRAINTNTDWPQYIAEEWLMFNREFGTLENVMDCIEKCKKICPIQTNVQTVEIKQTNSENVNRRISKRAHEDTKDSRIQPKRQKTEIKKPENKKPIEKDPKISVFVSNLHPRVDEDTLKKFFPNAVNIEVVYDRKGKSKCFAYVQFSKEEEVMVALARDREPLDGRPVFISEIKTERTEKKPVFKYATTTEKNKLFVRGLPVKKTKEEIEEIFKKHGAIDVRLVLHKSGQPKGLAYIEFKDEEAAQKAMKETNDMEIDGHKISVAISAPPPKKSTERGIEGKEPVRHARSRLQVPLIPRTVQLKTGEKKESNGDGGTPKSNADFRNMLLKK